MNMNMNRFFLTSLLLLVVTMTSFAKISQQQIDDDKFVVVLDAGHGGHDPGNLGNGYLEKNIALNIVLKVGKILETNPDIKVIYTRKDDTFIDLFVRGEIANKANADLFVSVHCDSHTSDAHGAGTFVLGLHANKQNFEIAKKENSVIYLEDNYEDRYADYDINSPESIIGLTIMQEEFLDQSIALAKMIQDNFSGKLKRNNRKVKQAGFIVLHQTFMPSVLVETGFLTNKTEGAYLNSKAGQAKMGTAIAEAIFKYKGGVQSNVAETKQQTISTEVVEKPQEPVAKEVVDVKVDKPVDIDVAEEESKKDKIASAENTNDIADKPISKEENKKDVEKKIVLSDKPKIQEKKEEVAAVPVKEKVVEKEAPKLITKEVEESNKPKVIFKVQLMASVKDLELQPKNFNGLGRLSKEPYKNMYRYLYGITNSFKEAKMLKSNADMKGYTTSYIVAYKDGERISLPEARKYASD